MSGHALPTACARRAVRSHLTPGHHPRVAAKKAGAIGMWRRFKVQPLSAGRRFFFLQTCSMTVTHLERFSKSNASADEISFADQCIVSYDTSSVTHAPETLPRSPTARQARGLPAKFLALTSAGTGGRTEWRAPERAMFDDAQHYVGCTSLPATPPHCPPTRRPAVEWRCLPQPRRAVCVRDTS